MKRRMIFTNLWHRVMTLTLGVCLGTACAHQQNQPRLRQKQLKRPSRWMKSGQMKRRLMSQNQKLSKRKNTRRVGEC